MKRSLKTAGPFLLPDERIDHVCRVRTKPVTADRAVRNTVAATAGVAAAMAFGHGAMVLQVSRTYCMILTDRRLMLLPCDRHAQTLPELAYQVWRAQITARRVSSFPSGRIVLESAPGVELVTLVFPLGVRMDGTNFLEALAAGG